VLRERGTKVATQTHGNNTEYGLQFILAHPFCEKEYVFPQGKHAVERKLQLSLAEEHRPHSFTKPPTLSPRPPILPFIPRLPDNLSMPIASDADGLLRVPNQD
jgi:hypothetical protein